MDQREGETAGIGAEVFNLRKIDLKRFYTCFHVKMERSEIYDRRRIYDYHPLDATARAAERGERMNEECCATCDYWEKRWEQCEHPYQYACEAEEYMSPPDKVCGLYKRLEPTEEGKHDD